MLAGLIFVLAVLFIGSLFWITYNLRIARRGQRSRETPYFPGTREKDPVGRPVVIEDLEALRASPVVVIAAGDEGKSYVRDEPGRV